MSCKFCSTEVSPGRKSCEYHLALRRAAVSSWAQKQRAAGLCTSCTEPAVAGLSKCVKHREAFRTSSFYSNRRHVARRHGLSYDEFEELQKRSNDLCAICKQPETAAYAGKTIKRLAVDHDHETGQVRGLLCNNCNRALGMFKDDPEVLRAAAEYLESHRVVAS